MAGLKKSGSENTWWFRTHVVLKGNRVELMGQLSKANTGETTPNQHFDFNQTHKTSCVSSEE